MYEDTQQILRDTQQQQSTPVITETALHYFLGKSSSVSKRKTNGLENTIVIKEAMLMDHLNLRGNPDNKLFVEGVEQVLGVKLPTQPGRYEINVDTRIYWLGPTEWLVIVKAGTKVQVESELRDILKGHISIVDISGGQTLINLSGNGVSVVLKKSSVYDFHPQHFNSRRCVQTIFAKTTALISKQEDGSFDLIIRRSFADYLAKWLLDAGGEFGCTIVQASL